MSDQGTNPGNGEQPNGPTGPMIRVLGQYVKDLSFENPSAPASFNARPQIDLNVDLQAKRLDQERCEVELKLRVSAKAEDQNVFMLELVYGGLFLVQNMPEEMMQQVLLIEAPHLLFPFARRIVSDVIRDGGMPPLMIEPIDFAGMYQQRQGEIQRNPAPVADA
ncbi:MAG TPA: protein-export chaperone SecB [Rhizomicrobium sp.]|jgi:preprotein translocase subunit SecB|nr:protein-export chaperone SecB [Rhizomicrobium sp.]HEX4533696.1 protein-export chaperone SecB [Rhizomicrobium sp.]